MSKLSKRELAGIVRDFDLHEHIIAELWKHDNKDLELKDYVFSVNQEQSDQINEVLDEDDRLDKVIDGIKSLSNAYKEPHKNEHSKRVMAAAIELRSLIRESLEDLIEIDEDKLLEAMNPDRYNERPEDEDLEYAIRIKKLEG